MAGDYDGQWILSVRRAHRAGRFRIADALREFRIRNRLAVGDLLQASPYRSLEGSAFGRKREIEARPAAGEVFAQLFCGFGERASGSGFGPSGPRAAGLPVRKSDEVNRVFVTRHQQRSHGSFEITELHALRYHSAMALAFLLLVLFIVVAMITLFIFPPTKWVKWFYSETDNQQK